MDCYWGLLHRKKEGQPGGREAHYWERAKEKLAKLQTGVAFRLSRLANGKLWMKSADRLQASRIFRYRGSLEKPRRDISFAVPAIFISKFLKVLI